jgi:hypothetical protein
VGVADADDGIGSEVAELAHPERIIEWDWPDAPRRSPFVLGDVPAKPEPLPRYLTDHDAARLMAAAHAEPLRRSSSRGWPEASSMRWRRVLTARAWPVRPGWAASQTL